MMTTRTTQEVRAVKEFGERLIRVFERNQKGRACTCGQREGHLPDCPQHEWEAAATLTQMELEDTIG